MIIKTPGAWDIVIKKIADEGKAPLICYGIRVLLVKTFSQRLWKTYITPVVEGTNYEERCGFSKPGERFPDDMMLLLDRFYYAIYKYVTEKGKRKRRHIWTYDSFPHPNALIKQYSKNFQRIELLEHVSEKGLLPGVDNQLPHPPPALSSEVTS